MSSKHGPNTFSSYYAIHETVMHQFLREGFVISAEELSFEAVEGEKVILLSGRIECLGDIYIDVNKMILILAGEGADAVVQTAAYSYNAAVRGYR